MKKSPVIPDETVELRAPIANIQQQEDVVSDDQEESKGDQVQNEEEKEGTSSQQPMAEPLKEVDHVSQEAHLEKPLEA